MAVCTASGQNVINETPTISAGHTTLAIAWTEFRWPNCTRSLDFKADSGVAMKLRVSPEKGCRDRIVF